MRLTLPRPQVMSAQEAKNVRTLALIWLFGGIICGTLTCIGFRQHYGSDIDAWAMVDGVRSIAIWVILVIMGTQGIVSSRNALDRGILQSGLPLFSYFLATVFIMVVTTVIGNIPLPD